MDFRVVRVRILPISACSPDFERLLAAGSVGKAGPTRGKNRVGELESASWQNRN